MSNKATRILGNGGSFLFDPASGQAVAVGSTTPGTRSIAFGSTINCYAALSGGLTVYAVNNSIGGQEPWVTDGTTAGTHILSALAPGRSSTYSTVILSTQANTVTGSFATNFVSLDATRALFTALDPTGIRRLWITNGSAAGTAAVSASVVPDLQEPIVALGDGRALFQGSDGRGNELWVTDGTASGTRLVMDILPGQGTGSAAGVPNGSYPRGFVALGGERAMFAANDATGSGLWITDGTAANTRKFVALDSPRLLSLLGNGLVIFENGSQPWVTDGTAAGTRLLALLTPDPFEGTRDLPVSGFGVLRDGRALFFIDRDIALRFGSAGQRLLYVTDGTQAGTTLVKDFGGGGNSVAQSSFLQLADGRVSFSAGLGPVENQGIPSATALVIQAPKGVCHGSFQPHGRAVGEDGAVRLG